jgi:hypothetical protein
MRSVPSHFKVTHKLKLIWDDVQLNGKVAQASRLKPPTS